MQKGIITILCLFLFLAFSCKEKEKSDIDASDATIEINAETESKTDLNKDEKSGDCEDFVDAYEKWMDSYIDLLTKYKEDPVSLATAPEYRDMSMEMMEWTSKWSELAIDCARYPEYETRFREIQEKAEKEMEALGFE